MPEIVIALISPLEGNSMRAQVLRPDARKLAFGAAQYEDIAAIHLGAYRDGSLEAVVSFTPYDEQGSRTLTVYQIRGAATRTEARGKGVGSALISAGIEICRQKEADFIWCDGRSGARAFYERLGFRIVGMEFTTDTGAHFRFKRDLSPSR